MLSSAAVCVEPANCVEGVLATGCRARFSRVGSRSRGSHRIPARLEDAGPPNQALQLTRQPNGCFGVFLRAAVYCRQSGHLRAGKRTGPLGIETHMRKSNKRTLGAIAIAGVLCVGIVMCLQTRAPDFWGYGKLGLSDGTAQSPVFFVEVRGVGARPTIAYLVRCPDQSATPKNVLDVSHSVVGQFDERTRVIDRWRSDCVLLVGRSVGETIEIPLDGATAQHWFGPGATIGDFANCQRFWDKFVSPRIAEFDRNNRAVL